MRWALLALTAAGCVQDTRPAIVVEREVFVDAAVMAREDRVGQLLDAGAGVVERDLDDAAAAWIADVDSGVDAEPFEANDADDADSGVDPEPAPPPASQGPATCEVCTIRGDCADDHFCWPVNDSNRCLPLTSEDSYSKQCSALGMDGRSLPDGTHFCRPLTGDCDQWLLLQ